MSTQPVARFESLTLHHCASPPTQPIVLIRVCVSLIEASDFINPSGDTTTSADLRCAAYCRYRCVASAATRSGARCRCHSAAAVSLGRCLPFSADPSAAPCTPWIVLHLLPDLFVRDRASTDVVATPRWTLRDSHTSRLVQSFTPRRLRCSFQVRSPGCFSSPSLVLLRRMSIRQSRTTCSLSSDEPPGSILRELAV